MDLYLWPLHGTISMRQLIHGTFSVFEFLVGCCVIALKPDVAIKDRQQMDDPLTIVTDPSVVYRPNKEFGDTPI